MQPNNAPKQQRTRRGHMKRTMLIIDELGILVPVTALGQTAREVIATCRVTQAQALRECHQIYRAVPIGGDLSEWQSCMKTGGPYVQ